MFFFYLSIPTHLLVSFRVWDLGISQMPFRYVLNFEGGNVQYTYMDPWCLNGLTRVAIWVDFVDVVGWQRSRYGITETSAQANAVVHLDGVTIHVGYYLFDWRACTPRMLVWVQHDIVDLEKQKWYPVIRYNILITVNNWTLMSKINTTIHTLCFLKVEFVHPAGICKVKINTRMYWKFIMTFLTFKELVDINNYLILKCKINNYIDKNLSKKTCERK